jgi:transcriptional regulator of arginine metabolism
MHIHPMNDLKGQRQRALTELLRSSLLASQEELAERLVAAGYAATQATVSRDLDQLGAVKLRKDGRTGYALPASGGTAGPGLAAVVRDWVRSIVTAGDLVVIKTPPGSAHLVGVALDQAELDDVVGTICGDDTIFIATPGPARAAALTERLNML